MQNVEHRSLMFSNFLKLSFECPHHLGEQANMIVTKEEVNPRGLICALCLPSSKQQAKQQIESKSLKMTLLQIHQTCGTLMGDVPTAAFVDHHINLIRLIAKNHFKEFQSNLQNAITVYFLKIRQLLNGKYFMDFYTPIANVVALRSKGPNHDKRQVNVWMQKLLTFIYQFDKLVNEYNDYDEYASTPLEEKLMGVNMVKYIRSQVGSMYKQFKEKVQGSKKAYQEQQILEIFNPYESSVKSYKFSNTLLHPDLKVTDNKNMKMPNLPDNEYTLLALIEPCIGNKKRTIKLKMNGIKGWMAAGIAYKSAADSFGYKFEQPTHGTVQMSYDGYSWGNDSSVNEVYTSWYYNQNDVLTITANPSTGELIFMRNQDANTHTLKFTKDKKDKIYFCVSVNYHGDQVTIVD